MIARIKLDEPVKRKKQRLRDEPNRMIFTDMGLERLRHPKAGQELYWDKKSVGLALLVGKKAKTFRSTYKYEGKWTARTLGRFPVVTLAQARAMVLEDRRNADQGIDPNAPKPVASKTSYGSVVDRFIEQYAKPRQRTWDQTQRVLKNNCKPWLNRPIDKITKNDAYELLDGFTKEDKGPKAAVTLAWMKKLWRWAWQRDIVAAPIMDAVKIDFERRVRDRFFTDAEIKAIWKAADKLKPTSSKYFKLLILLAPRKSALAEMRWSEVSRCSPGEPGVVNDIPVWTTPNARTKSKKTATKRIYLTPLPAWTQRILGQPNGELVFPGSYQGLSLNPDTRLIRKLIQHGAPTDFNYHAMRHTIATWLQNQGHSEWEIGLVLNHSGSGSVTAGYSHGYPLQKKLELLEKWASHVQGLVTPEGTVRLRG
jgi:integrase